IFGGPVGIGAAIALGAGLSAGGNLIDQATNGYPINWTEVAASAAFGTAGGAAGWGLGKAFQWAAKTPLGQSAINWAQQQTNRIPLIRNITTRLGANTGDDTLTKVTTEALPTPTPQPPTSTRISSPLWSPTNSRTAAQNALAHFNKHRADFPHLRNAMEYVAEAQAFVRTPPPGTLSKIRPNGDIIRYSQQSDLFGVANSSGAPRTYFKPSPSVHNHPTNLDYFNDQ
ncbi:MAG: hypothetical protein Q4D96_01645, partial [Propionibacteriaceae bacterium]|nr:hypothetical protein [Propionibacteriaceae bacterium]